MSDSSIANEITGMIEANKEILSTMPNNTKKNVEKIQEKVEELLTEYGKYKQDINNILLERYKEGTSIETNKDIETLHSRIKTLSKVMFLLSDEKNSYEKMRLDKDVYKLSKYYKGNLETVNDQIAKCISDFTEVGVTLGIDKFDYSMYVTEYMETFLKELNGGDIHSEALNAKFEEIFWKCPDLIMHIELNFRNLYLENESTIDKYFEKEKVDLLREWGKTPEQIRNSFLELKIQKDELVEKDLNINTNKFLTGKLNPKNYTDDKIKANCSKILPEEEIDEFETNGDIIVNICKFLNSLYEYKNYLEFRFIVNDIRALYKEKDNYKKVYDESKKNVDTLEKNLKRLNTKSSKKGFFGKKIEPQNQAAEQANIIKELREAYKELEINEFYQKMSEVLNDNSTLFDALHLAYSYYNYLIPCLIKNNKTITQEEMDLQIKHLGKFLDSPYNTIINNVSLIEEKDIALMIKDRYKLLGFLVEKEDFSQSNLDGLIATLEDIKIGMNVKKIGINVEDIDDLLSVKKLLKL